MPDLGNAYVNIVPKAPGIEGKVENLLGGGGRGAEKAGEGLGKRLLGGIAKLGIGSAIGSTIKSAFEAGGDLEQSFGGLDTIYEEASAAAKQYAMDAAQAGISANNYAEQAVSFGAALKQAYGGDTAAAAEAANTAIMDMADNAAKMGTPLESLQNAYQGFAKGNYTMLDNLKLGYGGTAAEMQRLLKDAQALSGVEYDISNLGDVYSAIHVIQSELGLTGVAAGEAKTTLTGSMNAVKASWENVMAAMTTGEGLDTAMSNLTESVGNFADNVLKMLGELGPQLPGLILGLADVILDNAPSFLATGVELILQLGVGLIRGIPDLLAKVPEIFAAVKGAFSEVDWLGIGAEIVEIISNGLESMGGKALAAIDSVISSIGGAISDFFDNLPYYLGYALGYALVKLQQWGNNLKTWAAEAIPSLINSIGEFFSRLPELLQSLPETMFSIGQHIVQGVWNGILSMASAFAQDVREFFGGVVDGAKKALGIASPSKVFADQVGQWIPAGIAEGIEDNLDPVDASVRMMADSSLRSIQPFDAGAPVFGSNTEDMLEQLLAALRAMKFDFYLDGKQITDSVTIRQRNAQRAGGFA